MANTTETKRVNISEIYPAALQLYTGFCDKNKEKIEKLGIVTTLAYPQAVTEEQMNTNAFEMVKVIKRIDNNGEIPNPLDTNQRKYYPWFIPNDSGSGLSCNDCAYWFTHSTLPARLCSLVSDTVEPAANEFQIIYDILQS